MHYGLSAVTRMPDSAAAFCYDGAHMAPTETELMAARLSRMNVLLADLASAETFRQLKNELNMARASLKVYPFPSAVDPS